MLCVFVNAMIIQKLKQKFYFSILISNSLMKYLKNIKMDIP